MEHIQGHEVGAFLFYNGLTPEQANWIIHRDIQEGLKVFKKYYTDSGFYSILTWKYTDEATYLSYKESLAKEFFNEVELKVGGVQLDYPVGY